MIKKISYIAFILIMISCMVFPCFATSEDETIHTWSENENNSSTKEMNNNTNETVAEITDDNTLGLESGSAILIEQTTRSSALLS